MSEPDIPAESRFEFSRMRLTNDLAWIALDPYGAK